MLIFDAGSTIKFDIDSRGKKSYILSIKVTSSNFFPKITYFNIGKEMFSNKYQKNKKPNANAERFTNIPKNKQKEKKAVSLIK